MRRHSGLRKWLRRRRSTVSDHSKHSDHSIDAFKHFDAEACSSDGSLTPDSLHTGPIEKGSKDGQGTYADDLVKALKAGVTSGSRARAGSKGKKGKKGKKGDVQSGGDASPAQAKGRPKRQEDDWGLLDFLRPVLGPVVDPIKPLFSARSMCGFLLFLLIVTWFRNSRVRAVNKNAILAGPQHWSDPSAYERTWHKEEDALWKWLEERVGMKNGVPVTSGDKANADKTKTARKARQQVLRGRSDSDDMSVREIEYALQVTKEKLGKLERAVGIHFEDEETGQAVEEPAGV